MMRFRDRTDAGRHLAAALSGYHSEEPLVLALPRGGVPVAAEVATALGAPLDLLLVRKIGVPWHPELAAGAVVDAPEPIVVRNEDVIAHARVSETDFERIKQAELSEIERRRTQYLGGRRAPDVRDRTVIVVDDGVATGATMRAALRALRAQRPRLLVLAVPVGPADTIAALEAEADHVVCLEVPADFGGVGQFYDDFRQVSDTGVTATLSAFAPAPKAEA